MQNWIAITDRIWIPITASRRVANDGCCHQHRERNLLRPEIQIGDVITHDFKMSIFAK